MLQGIVYEIIMGEHMNNTENKIIAECHAG